MIIIVFGLPGSGKSFFANKLAKKLNGQYFGTDKTRKVLYKIPTYNVVEKKAVYDFLLSAMGNKTTIVYDGTFYKKALRERFKNKAIELKNKIHFIEVIADEKIIQQRTSKQREESDADYSVYKMIKAQFEPMNESHLLLESKKDNLDEMINKTIHYLNNQNE